MTRNCVITLEGKVGTNGDTENRCAWAVHPLLIHRQRWRVIKLNNTVIGICVGKTTRGMPLKTNEISMATMTLALFDGVEMKYWLDWIF